jgi:hypothetical protein
MRRRTPLEAIQRGPVLIEPVEELRVDGVGGLHPLAVIALGYAGGELARRIAVHSGEGIDHGIARGIVDVVAEETAAHDFEALIR